MQFCALFDRILRAKAGYVTADGRTETIRPVTMCRGRKQSRLASDSACAAGGGDVIIGTVCVRAFDCRWACSESDWCAKRQVPFTVPLCALRAPCRRCHASPQRRRLIGWFATRDLRAQPTHRDVIRSGCGDCVTDTVSVLSRWSDAVGTSFVDWNVTVWDRCALHRAVEVGFKKPRSLKIFKLLKNL